VTSALTDGGTTMTEPIDTLTPEGGNVPTPEPKPAEKKREFTQEELDKMFSDRASQAEKATAKKFQKQIEELTAQIDEFKGKDLGELEKLQKKLEKATKDLADKDTELTGTRLELMKTKALLRAGAPPEKVDRLLKRVAGTTEEEISADVQELVALGWIGKAPEAEGKPAANGSGKPPVKDSIKKFTKAQLSAMTPEEYDANRADIMKAMEAGQIT